MLLKDFPGKKESSGGGIGRRKRREREIYQIALKGSPTRSWVGCSASLLYSLGSGGSF